MQKLALPHGGGLAARCALRLGFSLTDLGRIAPVSTVASTTGEQVTAVNRVAHLGCRFEPDPGVKPLPWPWPKPRKVQGSMILKCGKRTTLEQKNLT
jgi:hypothetical protein